MCTRVPEARGALDSDANPSKQGKKGWAIHGENLQDVVLLQILVKRFQCPGLGGPLRADVYLQRAPLSCRTWNTFPSAMGAGTEATSDTAVHLSAAAMSATLILSVEGTTVTAT
eukprot:1139743-Pelagomonas_calceolata.AAC.6